MNRNSSNLLAVVSYITWIGWLIALVARDRNDDFTTHHLNQALVLNIATIVAGVCAVVPLIGRLVAGVLGLAVSVLWIIGIVRAITWNSQPLPFIGDIRLL